MQEGRSIGQHFLGRLAAMRHTCQLALQFLPRSFLRAVYARPKEELTYQIFTVVAVLLLLITLWVF
jgi:hypothetical protein